MLKSLCVTFKSAAMRHLTSVACFTSALSANIALADITGRARIHDRDTLHERSVKIRLYY